MLRKWFSGTDLHDKLMTGEIKYTEYREMLQTRGLHIGLMGILIFLFAITLVTQAFK